MSLDALFRAVADGTLAPDDAVRAARASGSALMGFAHLDLDRPRRTGDPEVVYGAGKSADQIAALLQRLADAGQPALATRVDATKAARVCALVDNVVHDPVARTLLIPAEVSVDPIGHVAVVCAGTSDLPVAEEAAVTAEVFGSQVVRHVDIGVAGLHRLLSKLDELRQARVIVAVAGMEGALPTVMAGLVSAPIIAVPTSVGYGAHLQGLTPMLGMLTACAPGMTVVNIDNGFGAAVVAHRINRLGAP